MADLIHVGQSFWTASKEAEPETATHPCDDWFYEKCMCKGACSCHWEQPKETVNHPAHYGGDVPYEPIKLIVDWGLGFCAGNALKYIMRAPHKGSEAEDLAKARWYLHKAIEVDERIHNSSRQPRKLNPYDAIAYWKTRGLTDATGRAVEYIALGSWHFVLQLLDGL